MCGGGQAEAGLLQKVPAVPAPHPWGRQGWGGGGAPLFSPFAHSAAFSAHSPSCLLRASLAAVTATPQY